MFVSRFLCTYKVILTMWTNTSKLFYTVDKMLKQNMRSFEGFLDHLGLQLVQLGCFSFVWGVIDKLTTKGRRRGDIRLSFHVQLLEWYAESLKKTTLVVFLFWVIGKLQVSTVWEKWTSPEVHSGTGCRPEMQIWTGPIPAEFTWSDTRRLLPRPQDEEFSIKDYSYSAKMSLSIWAAVHRSQSVT